MKGKLPSSQKCTADLIEQITENVFGRLKFRYIEGNL